LKHFAALSVLVVLLACAFAASSSFAQQLKRTGLPGSAAPNHAVINGTGMSRTGAGPGTVGGAAKSTGTSINGTTVRPRH
jgi:hypothetical protein